MAEKTANNAKQLTQRAAPTAEPGSYSLEDGKLTLREPATKTPALFAQVEQPAAPSAEPEIQESLSPEDEQAVNEALDDVVTAIGLLDPNDQSLWTKHSGPRLSALEAVLGHPITEEMRTLAWETFQQPDQEN